MSDEDLLKRIAEFERELEIAAASEVLPPASDISQIEHRVERRSSTQMPQQESLEHRGLTTGW